MKIEKAKKILFDYVGTGPEVEPVEFDKAVRLGAEALKRIKFLRGYSMTQIDTKLPGETEE